MRVNPASLRRRLGIQPEVKLVQRTYGPTNVGNTLVLMFDSTDGIAQGLTSTDRIGRQYRLKSDKLRFQIENFSNHCSTEWFRIIGIRLLINQDQVPPNPTFILANTSLIQSGYSTAASNWKIVYDRTIHLSPYYEDDVSGIYVGGENNRRLLNITYAPKNHLVKWRVSDTSGSNLNMLEGGLVWYAMASTSSAVSFTCFEELRWTDV